MPRVSTIEDTYEYRVKRIFNDLRQEYKDHESALSFEAWLESNTKIVGRLFLEDVESYMEYPADEDYQP